MTKACAKSLENQNIVQGDSVEVKPFIHRFPFVIKSCDGSFASLLHRLQWLMGMLF